MLELWQSTENYLIQSIVVNIILSGYQNIDIEYSRGGGIKDFIEDKVREVSEWYSVEVIELAV